MQTHQSLFVSYIVAGVTTSWQQIHASETPIAEPVRQQAWHILSFALGIPAAWSVTRTLLLTLAPKMEQAGFRDEWIPYLEKGLACAQAAGDEQAAAECELQIGLLYRLLSRFDEAKEWTKASVEHFAAQGDTQAQARALNELAWLEHLQQCYVDATRHVEEALSLLTLDDPERAMCYRVQGMIAMEQGRLQEAEVFHQRALTIFEQQHDRRRAAWSLHNLAYAIRAQNRLVEAIPYYQQALTILEEVDDRNHWAIVKLNLGNAFLYHGEPEKSIIHLVEAEEIFSQRFEQLQLARVATNLGLAYLALNRFVEAQKAFLISIHLYKILKVNNWYLNAVDGLAMVYLASEQHEQAAKVLQEAIDILPTITEAPNHAYLHQSLHTHLQQARQGQKVL